MPMQTTTWALAALAQPNPSDQSLGVPGASGPPSAPKAGEAVTGAGNGTTGATGVPTTASPQGGSQLLFIMVGMLALMIFVSVWSGRKEKKKREQLMSAMGKGDLVQTIGGAVGTIEQVRDNEVVIRFEDMTKIKFVKSAVQTILKPAGGKPAGQVEAKGAKEPAGAAS